MKKSTLKIGSKVVMLHPQKRYSEHEKMEGVIWTVREFPEFPTGNKDVYLEGLWGPVAIKDLIEVFPEKKYCDWKTMYQHTVPGYEADATREYFKNKGIQYVERKVDTWFGGKDSVEFSFMSQSNDVSKLMHFSLKLDLYPPRK